MKGFRSLPKAKQKKQKSDPVQKGGISAVLIVKNEEAVIDRCLESLAGVDQVVVLDTGSKDRTFSKALRYTRDVSATPAIVPFHFAEARNRADGYARHDWILTIDADEVLLPNMIEKIQAAIQSKPWATGFQVDFIVSEDGADRASLPKMKVYKRGAWRWTDRVHERLLPVDHTPKVEYLPDVQIEHLPQKDKAERRAQNLALLEMAVVEAPDYVRNMRQLGMEYFVTGQWKEAVDWLRKYTVRFSGDPLDLSETLIYLGKALAELGHDSLSESAYREAIEVAPERREPYFWKAVFLMKRGRAHEALLELDKCLAIPEDKKPKFHLNLDAVWDGSLPKEAIQACQADIAEAARPQGKP